MVQAYWVYGLCVDQHAIQIRTHVFWQPGLRATEREGAFVWLELVCCPKPSAALSVIICSENNSSFLGADSQSWFESSPACLGTLRFVLSIYGFVRHCSLDLSSTSMDLCFVVFGFVLFIPGFVRFCTLDLWSNSVDLCVAVLWICPLRQWIFVLLSWICALLPWICALLYFGFRSPSMDLCVAVLWICPLHQWICVLFYYLCSSSMLFCFIVLSFNGNVLLIIFFLSPLYWMNQYYWCCVLPDRANALMTVNVWGQFETNRSCLPRQIHNKIQM